MKKISFPTFIISLFLCCVISVTATIAFEYKHRSEIISGYTNGVISSNVSYKGLDKLGAVKKYADENFVGEVDIDLLDEELTAYYVSLLDDKYSEYLDKDKMTEYNNSLNSQVVGIGVAYSWEGNKIKIESVYKDSPAHKCGFKKGEYIVKVEGVSTSENDKDASINAIKGEVGTEVTLTLEGTDGVQRDVKVVRDAYFVDTVAFEMLENNVAYIIISRFSANTDKEFQEALKKASEQGAKKYVFDVRGNPGGSLSTIVNVLDRLLPAGPVVNITYGNGSKKTYSSKGETYLGSPMAVLIDENTASAAELFAAALRDYKVAKLFGKTTYGKGYMQNIFSYPDGTGLRISVARYDPPYGENYEGIGVKPDFEIESSGEKDLAFEKALEYLDGLNS